MAGKSLPPMRDPALCIELGQRVVTELMTREDWAEQIDRILGWHEDEMPRGH